MFAVPLRYCYKAGLKVYSYIIVTNNPITAQNTDSNNILCYSDGADAMDILRTVRTKVHEGHKLATHPLTSSLKPNETPYKTVLLYSQKGRLCAESLELVESAISLYERFVAQKRPRLWSGVPQRILEDLATIDCDMVRQWI